MTDFSVPQRMGVSAFLVILAKIAKSIIGFIFIVVMVKLFGADNDYTDTSYWLRTLLIIGGAAVLSVLLALMAYLPKKFYVKDGNLIFSHGIIRRETTTIPLARIHTLRTNQGIIYRLLDMRGITFDTIASKTEELELILDEDDWNALQSLIEKEKRPVSNGLHTPTDTPTDIPPAFNAIPTIRFRNESLLLDALCQNHLKGMSILLGILAFIYDRLNDVVDNAADTITDYTLENFEKFSLTPLHIIIISAVVYAIVLFLWIGKSFLRYGNMSLNYDNSLLTFSHGLLSRASSRLPFDKVCTIWVKRNFFEKKLGLCTLMLRQALNVTATKEDDNLKLYGADKSTFFLKWWLGENYSDESVIVRSCSGKGVFVHKLIVPAAITLAAGLILWHFHLYVWLTIPAIYFLFSVIRGLYAMRKSCITLRQSYAVISNGSFADMCNYLKYGDIEVVRINNTPFTKLFHRTTLTVSTSGTTFSVRSLPEEESRFIYELLLSKSENLSS